MSELAYEKWLLLHNRSKRTIFNRLKNLKVLLREVPAWNKDAVDDFVVGLKRKGCLNSTINTYIATVRTYAEAMGLADDLKTYHFMKVLPSIKGTMSDAEIDAFLNLPKPNKAPDATWKSERLFFGLLCYLGCRPYEIARLQAQFVTDSTITILETKNDRIRNVPLKDSDGNLTIPQELYDSLFEHIRQSKGPNLFVTMRGCIYSDHFWIPAFAKRIRMLTERGFALNRPNISCYSLRHSSITRKLQKDVDITKVSKMHGTSVEQIAKTYSHMVTADVANAMRKDPLLRKHSKATSQEVALAGQDWAKNFNCPYEVKIEEHGVSIYVRTDAFTD